MIGDACANKRPGFTGHDKLAQLLQHRHDISRNGGIDWGMGELMALASLLVEGTPGRFAGQDARRGTLVHRPAVLPAHVNGQESLPLANPSDSQGRFWIYDSLLSEYAAMGFDHGYS